jgi:hypothetical protein
MNYRELAGRRPYTRLLGLAALVAGSFLLAAALRAEDAAPGARAVRLSSVEGQVRITQNNQVLADPALANTPLFEGTQILTSDDGRAEVQFEDGSVARISPNSSLTLTVLRPPNGTGNTGAETEIALEGGLAYFEIQGQDAANPIRVRFANSVVTAEGFTLLRVNMDNPPGEVAVFSGNAHVEQGSSQRVSALALDLHGGESVVLNGADPSRYNLSEMIEPDSWDAWNADRDQLLTAEKASQTGAAKGFADSNNPAWTDLDASGNWYNVPGQGYVWSPYDAMNAGWDPYGSGYWMLTPQFGYIWVSSNTWGYLPYQCGAWNFYNGFGWGWAPGMGGCQPWWGRGFYGINIGLAPGGYLPPRWPRQPIRRPPGGGGGTPRPVPLIAVNRHSTAGGSGPVVRSRNTPAVIAGQTVLPLRPLSPRSFYNHSSPAIANQAQPASPGAGAFSRPGYTAGPNAGVSQRPANAAGAAPYGNSGQYAPMPSHVPSGGGSPRPSSAGSGGGGNGNAAAGGSRSGGGGGAHNDGGAHR